MPTKQPRLSIILKPEQQGMIAALAKANSVSLAAMGSELIAHALDLYEDAALSAFAAKREKTTKKWISHEDAWK